jgi:hypothetical protein
MLQMLRPGTCLRHARIAITIVGPGGLSLVLESGLHDSLPDTYSTYSGPRTYSMPRITFTIHCLTPDRTRPHATPRSRFTA